MSEAASPVAVAQQRSWSYWFSDGVPDLFIGASCLLSGAIVAAGARTTNRVVIVALEVVAAVLFVHFEWFMGRVVEWLKSRITYPRTGYASTPFFAKKAPRTPDLILLRLRDVATQDQLEVLRLHQGAKTRFWILGMVYLLILFAIWRTEVNWIHPAVGLVAGLTFWLLCRRNPLRSWVLFRCVAPGSFFLAFAQLCIRPSGRRIDLVFAGVGVVFLLCGAIRLGLHLQRHPLPRPAR